MSDLKNAQRLVDESREQIDEALAELETRFSESRDSIRATTQSLRSFPSQVGERHPLSQFGIFLMAGYLLGNWIAQRPESMTKRGNADGRNSL